MTNIASTIYHWGDHINMVLILISSETHLGLASMKMTILCCEMPLQTILRPACCQTKEVNDLRFFSWQLHVLEAGSKELQDAQFLRLAARKYRFCICHDDGTHQVHNNRCNIENILKYAHGVSPQLHGGYSLVSHLCLTCVSLASHLLLTCCSLTSCGPPRSQQFTKKSSKECVGKGMFGKFLPVLT